MVVIWWKDSALHGLDQRSRQELRIKGLVRGISAGVLVHEDAEQITLASDYFPDEDQFRQASSYPKRMIARTRRIPIARTT